MNRETLITLGCVVCAAVLVTAAAYVEPEARRPDVFSDQGEVFFPAFRDVNAAKAIEVVDYDPTDAVARPLKVELRKGKWVISSHYDYPAEARELLAKLAASFVDLKKEQVVSDRVEDHGTYGVIDPLDAKVASLTGRGKRVTLRDEGGSVLADMILGEPVKGKAGRRHVRLPGQKRVYAVALDANPSASFEDWAESDLLRVTASQIRQITILNYSINQDIGGATSLERTTLTRSGDQWKLDGGANAKPAAVQSLVNALDGLRVAGVRPKPADLASQLKSGGQMEMTLEAVMSMRQRGYFLSPDGRLVSKEGELMVETEDGVLYSLRFGEIVSGQTDDGKPASAAAATPTAAAATKPQENRYLFINASYSPERAAKYGGKGNGEALAAAQRTRFAGWYYVIKGADFNRIRPKRAELQ